MGGQTGDFIIFLTDMVGNSRVLEPVKRYRCLFFRSLVVDGERMPAEDDFTWIDISALTLQCFDAVGCSLDGFLKKGLQ